jgi:hypothetical protein
MDKAGTGHWHCCELLEGGLPFWRQVELLPGFLTVDLPSPSSF